MDDRWYPSLGWRTTTERLQRDIRDYIQLNLEEARYKPFRFPDGSCYWGATDAKLRLKEQDDTDIYPVSSP